MKVTITTQTMAEILGIGCTDDNSAIALALQKFGAKQDLRTIKTHVESGDVSALFDIPMLARICRDRHCAFAPCMEIMDDSGLILGNRLKGCYHTDEPLKINVKGLAREIIRVCPVSVIQKELNIMIDRHLIYLVGHGDISCLSGIPSGKFISFLLTWGINLNYYFVQKGFSFPFVSRNSDMKVPNNRVLKSFRDLNEEFLDVTDEVNELETEKYKCTAEAAKVIGKCLSDSSMSKEDSLMEVAATFGINGKEHNKPISKEHNRPILKEHNRPISNTIVTNENPENYKPHIEDSYKNKHKDHERH